MDSPWARWTAKSSSSSEKTFDAGIRIRMMNEDSRTDAEIVSAVLAGDTAQFGVMVERYERLMYSYLLPQVRSLTEAEDIAQEAFIKAFRHLASFDAGRRFSAWLLRIARNVMIDRFRRLQNESAVISVSQDCLARVRNTSAKSDPAIHLEMHEEFRRTFQDILALPEELRAPLILRVLQELPYEEIADVLDLPIQTVKNRIFKARQALRGKRDAANDM